MANRENREQKHLNVAFVAVMGGTLALIVACIPPLAIWFTVPLWAGMPWRWYPVMVIMPPAVVILGGLVLLKNRIAGVNIVGLGGILIAIGYSSPASLIGVFFLYKAFRWNRLLRQVERQETS